MEGSSMSTWLLFIVVAACEYALKQWYEGWPPFRRESKFTPYVLFRGLHLFFLSSCLMLTFSVSLGTVLLGLAMSLAAATELPLAWIQARVLERTGARLRWLQLIPMAILSALCLWAGGGTILQPRPWLNDVLTTFPPSSITDFAVHATGTPVALVFLAVYTFLAHPANYVVRALVDKDTDRFLPEMTAFPPITDESMPTSGADARQAHHSPSPAPRASAAAELAPSLEEPGATTSSEPMASGTDEVPWETLRAGRIIGILERWLIVTLVVLSQYGPLGLVLTAKSVARLKQLEDATFAEYYLLGTLYSMVLAIAGGLFLQGYLF